MPEGEPQYNPLEEEEKAKGHITPEVAKENIEAERISEKHTLVPIGEIFPNLDFHDLPTIEEAVKNNRTRKDNSSLLRQDFGVGLRENFSVDLRWKDNNKLTKLLEKIKGQIVVDLGAGADLSGYNFIASQNPSAYVAVEPFFPDHLKYYFDNLDKSPDVSQDMSKPKVAIAPEDMLTFLKRLPDKSVSIFNSGIDDTIIPREYAAEVSKEIERVVHPEGVAVSHAGFIPLGGELKYEETDSKISVFIRPEKKKTDNPEPSNT